jgi:hypothetical protein
LLIVMGGSVGEGSVGGTTPPSPVPDDPLSEVPDPLSEVPDPLSDVPEPLSAAPASLPPLQVDAPQSVATSPTHCESQAVRQQKESCAQTAAVQESQDEVSGVECVAHSPHVGPPPPPLEQAGAGFAVGLGQSLN